VRNEESPVTSGEDSGLSALGFSAPLTPGTPPETKAPPRPGPLERSLKSTIAVSDHVFRAVATVGGLLVLVLMGLVGTFLAIRAWQALHKAGLSFLTTADWSPDGGKFGITEALLGSVLIAIVAVVVAVPLAMGAALYISEYAPRAIQRALIAVIDLMAAVPSIVFALWGFFLLESRMAPLAKWISHWFGWIPFLHVNRVDPNDPLASATSYESSTFIAGVVVALMVTPIACSIMREAFSQAPVGEREGAYALGATRWGMIRSVVLPFSRGAVIGGTMLGLGRALGETIAVSLIISPSYAIQTHILQSGANSISALIALHYGEATPFGLSALMAAGLALFAVTLVVNFIAARIVARSRSGAVSDA
jgi:phosphate transport system permease protein